MDKYSKGWTYAWANLGYTVFIVNNAQTEWQPIVRLHVFKCATKRRTNRFRISKTISPNTLAEKSLKCGKIENCKKNPLYYDSSQLPILDTYKLIR